MKTNKRTRFQCQECEHTFYAWAPASGASFAPEGCPECGGDDIQLAHTDTDRTAQPETAAERIARVREEAMARS
jgi:predicted  nucleic acid-binding Zn-ribbon protein